MIQLLYILIALVCIFTAGCATGFGPVQPTHLELSAVNTRQIAASYPRTFHLIGEALSGMNYHIQESDLERGRIVASKQSDGDIATITIQIERGSNQWSDVRAVMHQKGSSSLDSEDLNRMWEIVENRME